MLLVIQNVLDLNQLKVISRLLEDAEYDDGKLSAGKEAALVKNNLELSQETRTGEVLHQQLNQMVMPTLLKHPEYQNSVYPLKVASPFYVRYENGMQYGYHVDDPIMGKANASLQERYRSDISTTIFLNDDYQGGELIIKTAAGEQCIKANAGDVVIYSSNYLHKVNQVTSGTRYVAVTWAQSMVKDSAKREVLYELSQARDSLLDTKDNSDITSSQVSNVYANLLRRWSDL
ncbi:MAG: PKHD-type hydroxylase [Cocleimonas sp.]|jgi:PKHD-type hydroxylase